MAISLIETPRSSSYLRMNLMTAKQRRSPWEFQVHGLPLSFSLSLSDSWPGLMKLASSSLARPRLAQTSLHHRRSLHLCSSSIGQDHGRISREILSQTSIRFSGSLVVVEGGDLCEDLWRRRKTVFQFLFLDSRDIHAIFLW